MEGADVCFHAAAKVEDFGPWKEFVQANVEGTRNVLRACRAAGVGRAVHVSTEAVLMHGQPLVHADETYPLALRSKAPYSRSKAMAEQVVLEEGRGALEAVIVRPRFVWGRGDTTLLPLLVEGTRSGAFRWVGGGRHRTSTTHIDNTVEGLLCAAEHGRGGRAYFVTDGDPVVFRDFVGDLIATQGVTPPTGSVPAPVARALGRDGGDGLEAAAAAGRAAAHALRRLGRVAGVHARRHARPLRARLRAGVDARAGHARAARRGRSRFRPAMTLVIREQPCRCWSRSRVRLRRSSSCSFVRSRATIASAPQQIKLEIDQLGERRRSSPMKRPAATPSAPASSCVTASARTRSASPPAARPRTAPARRRPAAVPPTVSGQSTRSYAIGAVGPRRRAGGRPA